MSDNPWDVERFIEAARKVGEGLSVYPVASATTLAQGGWSAAPLDNMDAVEAIELVTRLQGKSDDDVKQELDVVIPAYFRKDDHAPLSDMVASWDLYFTDHRSSVSDDTLWSPHHQVFEDALWAHRKGRYTLSINALAPQFEGVGRDLMREYGEKKPSRWQDKLTDVLSYEPDKPSKPHEVLPDFMALPLQERLEKAEGKFEELNEHVTMLRIKEYFHEGNPSRAKAVWSVNRHSIAHGTFRNFVEVESLKLFFVLDLLHRAVGIYRDRAGPPLNPKAAKST